MLIELVDYLNGTHERQLQFLSWIRMLNNQLPERLANTVSSPIFSDFIVLVVGKVEPVSRLTNVKPSPFPWPYFYINLLNKMLCGDILQCAPAYFSSVFSSSSSTSICVKSLNGVLVSHIMLLVHDPSSKAWFIGAVTISFDCGGWCSCW